MKNVKIIDFDPAGPVNVNPTVPIGLTLSELQNCLRNIDRIVEQDPENFELLKAICFDLIRRIPLFIKKYPEGFLLRARANKPGEIFSHVDQISYNHNPKNVESGRFNLRGEPAFYCSEPSANDENCDVALTAMLETCKEIIDPASRTDIQLLTIGKWSIRKTIPAILLSQFQKAEDRSSYFRNVNRYLDYQSENMFLPGEKEKCSLVYNYFSTKAATAATSGKDYLITTAFYHALKEFYETDEVGIVYSSAATDNYGLNMVLSPSFVNNKHLELDLCVMYKCVRDPLNFKRWQLFPCSTECLPDDHGNFVLSMF